MIGHSLAWTYFHNHKFLVETVYSNYWPDYDSRVCSRVSLGLQAIALFPQATMIDRRFVHRRLEFCQELWLWMLPWLFVFSKVASGNRIRNSIVPRSCVTISTMATVYYLFRIFVCLILDTYRIFRIICILIRRRHCIRFYRRRMQGAMIEHLDYHVLILGNQIHRLDH